MLSALPADKSPPFKGQQALRDQWAATLQKKLGVLLRTVFVHAAPRMAHGLVTQVQRVMFGIKAEIQNANL